MQALCPGSSHWLGWLRLSVDLPPQFRRLFGPCIGSGTVGRAKRAHGLNSAIERYRGVVD